MKKVIVGLAWDIGLPLAVYYLFHAAGASDRVALLAAAAVSLLSIVWTAVRQRRLNPFATIMLVVYGVGFVLAMSTGDPRTVLLRNSFITAAVALLFIVSALHGRRPLALTALQSFHAHHADALGHRYREERPVRFCFLLATYVWGTGLLVEAVASVPLVYGLPVEVAVGATEGLYVVTIALLGGWTAWYMRHARDRVTVLD